jgi:hypothetical protein
LLCPPRIRSSVGTRQASALQPASLRFAPLLCSQGPCCCSDSGRYASSASPPRTSTSSGAGSSLRSLPSHLPASSSTVAYSRPMRRPMVLLHGFGTSTSGSGPGAIGAGAETRIFAGRRSSFHVDEYLRELSGDTLERLFLLFFPKSGLGKSIRRLSELL